MQYNQTFAGTTQSGNLVPRVDQFAQGAAAPVGRPSNSFFAANPNASSNQLPLVPAGRPFDQQLAMQQAFGMPQAPQAVMQPQFFSVAHYQMGPSSIPPPGTLNRPNPSNLPNLPNLLNAGNTSIRIPMASHSIAATPMLPIAVPNLIQLPRHEPFRTFDNSAPRMQTVQYVNAARQIVIVRMPAPAPLPIVNATPIFPLPQPQPHLGVGIQGTARMIQPRMAGPPGPSNSTPAEQADLHARPSNPAVPTNLNGLEVAMQRCMLNSTMHERRIPIAHPLNRSLPQFIEHRPAGEVVLTSNQRLNMERTISPILSRDDSVYFLEQSVLSDISEESENNYTP